MFLHVPQEAFLRFSLPGHPELSELQPTPNIVSFQTETQRKYSPGVIFLRFASSVHPEHSELRPIPKAVSQGTEMQHNTYLV